MKSMFTKAEFTLERLLVIFLDKKNPFSHQLLPVDHASSMVIVVAFGGMHEFSMLHQSRRSGKMVALDSTFAAGSQRKNARILHGGLVALCPPA